MSSVDIDRLALHVPGLDREDGERLATLVAHGLGSSAIESPFAAERLRLELSNNVHGMTLERLALEIVREIRRQAGQ